MCIRDRVDPVQAHHFEQGVDQTEVAAEQVAEDEADRHQADHVGQQHGHPPPGGGPQLGVEQRGEEHRDDELRNAGEHEDADGVDQRVPELRVTEQRDVVLQPQERGGVVGEFPVVQRHVGRVEQREQPDHPEQDEERGDVEIRGVLDVPLAQALPERGARPRLAPVGLTATGTCPVRGFAPLADVQSGLGQCLPSFPEVVASGRTGAVKSAHSGQTGGTRLVRVPPVAQVCLGHLASFFAPSTACFQPSSGAVPCSTACRAGAITLSWMLPSCSPLNCARSTFLAWLANTCAVLGVTK